MSKVALTQTGITELETTLYALTDPELLLVADAVRADFVHWVNNHIELTLPQFTWLSSIDELFLDLLAVKTAIAFRNRLPLLIDLPSTTGDGKWFLDKGTIAPKWEGSGEIT